MQCWDPDLDLDWIRILEGKNDLKKEKRKKIVNIIF
jgi:hypothetical protein